jgi:hypothetical protein
VRCCREEVLPWWGVEGLSRSYWPLPHLSGVWVSIAEPGWDLAFER